MRNAAARLSTGCYVTLMRRVVSPAPARLGLFAVFAVFAGLVLFAGASILFAGRAQADEVAPALETLELRQKAQFELKLLASALPAADQRRLTGLYLAFDTDAADPEAMVACDDDGDDVIVVTDAMLRLTAVVARAQSYDEESGSRKIEEFAEFISRSQIPGRRLLPPPPGFYIAQKSAASEDARLREALSFVVARELTHFRAGDLVCPHPTATHERGDDEWTSKEERRALETAATIYPGHGPERDIEATTRVLGIGRSEQGALGLLRFFAQLEIERTIHASRFLPTYLAQHPSSVVRIAAVKSAAKDQRAE